MRWRPVIMLPKRHRGVQSLMARRVEGASLQECRRFKRSRSSLEPGCGERPSDIESA